MVSLHEKGGTSESDLIKDADSISYWEVNSEKHINKFGKILGKKKLMAKYNFMFNRISSEKAKKFAKLFYKQTLKRLEESGIT